MTTTIPEPFERRVMRLRAMMRESGADLFLADHGELMAWLTGQPTEYARASVCIVGWQERLGSAPQYGALLFTGTPQKVKIQDEHACDLPKPPDWESVAISCFRYDGQPIPILDVPHIFSARLSRAPR